MRLFVVAFVLAAVVPARAHHPFTPYYDASKLVSVTGVIVELRDVNPHVVLIVDGTTTDGRSGLWAFEGLPPNAFQYRGLKNFREKLRAGTRMTISGWAAKDPTARAFSGREVTFANGSKMIFGLTPEDSDRWHCSAEPCPYNYPQVPSVAGILAPATDQNALFPHTKQLRPEGRWPAGTYRLTIEHERANAALPVTLK